jgi:SsrA-binding protein
MGEVEIVNRKALFHYKILETYEAGIQLQGTEVKSLRGGQAHLNESFAKIEKNEAWLYNFDISTYEQGNRENHEPKRKRKLLLHKAEIRKLHSTVSVAGRTLIPLKGYFKNQHFKILLGVGIGKNQRDKRQDLIKKVTDREIQRAMRRRR